MLARRLATILPARRLMDALETTRIPRVAGLTALVTRRPRPRGMPVYPDEHGRW